MSMQAHETDWVVGEWYVGKFTGYDLSFYDTNNCQERDICTSLRYEHDIKAG